MEKIDRINFLNIGFVDGNGDFFDHLKPGGVAILFGEENNFICYYKNDEKIQSIEKVEKIDAFAELMEPLGLKEIARTGIAAISRGE